MEIRNIAIIAHVDHGKTTITDAILRQTGMVSDEGISMDSNALEKERGITIYSKNTSIFYKDTKINIVDTPGHADFGSEVERVLRSIDSVILVVDAQEGPMPQTRFVLKKSLELGLKPIVVLNKIDKPAAQPEIAKEQVFELFLDLGASDEQLEFTTVYAIGREGIAKMNLDDDSKDLMPLLDTILKEVAPAKSDTTVPFRMQPFSLGYDNFLGRLAIGRVYEGKVKSGDVIIKKPNGEVRKGKIIKIQTFKGLVKEDVSEAIAGDIVMVAGLPDIFIGETICENEDQQPLPAIKVDEPTISLNFMVNDSPFAGREGKFVTNKQIRERLEKELEVNVGLRIDFSSDSYKVYGRGELHIAVLLENMRREGFEIQVSQPQVIIKEEDGKKLEPFEEVTADVPEALSGSVIEKIGKRQGIMTEMKQKNGQTRLVFEAPTRGILGYRSQFIVDTKGEGIFSSRFLEFRPYVGEIKKRNVGSMISMIGGKALGFSLANLQERGVLYIGAGTEVYEGMVIGNVSKGEDMSVNPIKGKQLTNMRASGTDDAIQLVPPTKLDIEKGMELMAEDEYLEVTPQSVRLRKQYLTENDRIRAKRKK
ncbi:MAG: GTP-binding protein TypA/BipA [Candidatus Moranbacteria bacterium GW2011_GWE2_35_2-]|nr:MAG: GTP-binding protein TypA/BipA [Candidatus Moranbacteria bacterium GW2011_GWE2_35_2-]KKQ22912.1 MAG: GTP-binding protein TypA/BipA [Candidatus Moranbacteria bacterium GW2011_GWF2_37_11]KKQ29270.1 MAG: GTP-binding protein TypA/BipA [Candidatus Moranbacteria bacterium GW2011_GWD1_37_17]KKQ30857.1 MAG: GTP-binding protein TypA/BipA [Candidatus Moranbacteria bacterium GW2011_GWE1_37_24]KKQ47294.1 MAG: GTP-binding protein TypA/BipA [Candidatus Moranbacteria bacterium GW2011_GWD2_37_9]HBO1694